jgi:hypothetical protein
MKYKHTSIDALKLALSTDNKFFRGNAELPRVYNKPDQIAEDKLGVGGIPLPKWAATSV